MRFRRASSDLEVGRLWNFMRRKHDLALLLGLQIELSSCRIAEAFLEKGTLEAAGVMLASKDRLELGSPPSGNADSRIEVWSTKPMEQFREYYGHFTENLSGVFYGGDRSAKKTTCRYPRIAPRLSAHAQDHRTRWFVCRAELCPIDTTWRDGIGPMEKRSSQNEFGMGGKEKSREPHNTIQLPSEPTNLSFLQVMSGAYLAANVRSLPGRRLSLGGEVLQFRRRGSTTLADTRSAQDSRRFRVKYWGVGNEFMGLRRRFSAGGVCGRVRRYVVAPDDGDELKTGGSGPIPRGVVRANPKSSYARGQGSERRMYECAAHYVELERGRTGMGRGEKRRAEI